MNILVDADACPAVIKETLFKAADRKRVQLIFVANRYIRVPASPLIRFILVSQGLDCADNKIVDIMEAGDLVVTSDIPLAAKVVAKGGMALDPRGEIYSNENIHERLSARNFMDILRASGIETGGPSALSRRDRQSFANSLDKLLQKHSKSN